MSPRLAVIAVSLLSAAALAAEPAPAAPPHAPAARSASPLAPLPPATPGLVAHAPYESGSCTPCHERDDAASPGAVDAKMNAVCLGCHAELEAMLAQKHQHAPAQDACTQCHNPHNARQPKLLLAEGGELCGQCHSDVVEAAGEMKVPHRALLVKSRCANCHNPHGSDNEKLLVQSTQALCLGCHDREGMKATDGAELSNLKAWLEKNPSQHSPVASGMCTSCHLPHGGPLPRLLTAAYPPEFYAIYSSKGYGLCFTCHEEAAFVTPRTTEYTGFRNGSKNLHYLHVTGLGGRGRTCRACHEVHASAQDHHLRQSVPYGSRGWGLKLNYVRSANGGSCSKTCHDTKVYDRSVVEATAANGPDVPKGR